MNHQTQLHKFWQWLEGRGLAAGSALVTPKVPEAMQPWEALGTRSKTWIAAREAARQRVLDTPRVAFEAMTPETLLHALREAYVAKKLRFASWRTAYKYLCAVRDFEFFLDRPATIGDLTEENIAGVMIMGLERGLCATTANWYRSKLLCLAKLAHNRGVLKILPDVERLIEPTRVPIGWTQDQLRVLFRACSQQRGDIDGVPAADWLVALHACLYDTGERIGAMLKAKWSGLNVETGWLTINAELRKGKREDKTWPLHRDTMAFLERIREPERDLIFPWPHHDTTLYHRYDVMLQKAGLPHTRKHKFHCLRKTSASFFKAAGGNAQEHLGHADANTTKVYMVPEIVQTARASELLARPYAAAPVALIGVDREAG
jgi:integrase